MSLKGG